MNRLDRTNRRAVWRLALASLVMFAFGDALGGKIPDQAALEGPLPGVDTTRNVKVELVAALNGAMPWAVTLSYTFFRAPEKETAQLTRGPAGAS